MQLSRWRAASYKGAKLENTAWSEDNWDIRLLTEDGTYLVILGDDLNDCR